MNNINIFFFWSLFTFIPNVYATSFNCSKAYTIVEKTICSENKLAGLDDLLIKSYKKAKLTKIDKNSLKADQILWLKEVRDKCQTSSCLEDVYKNRIQVLSEIISGNIKSFGAFKESINPSIKDSDKIVNVKSNINETQQSDDTKNKLKKMETDSFLYIYDSAQAYRESHFKNICPSSLYPNNFLKREADKGNAIAQSLFAGCYEFVEFFDNDVLTQKDPTKAVLWYRKAADQQYAPAQDRLGWAYLNGVGIKKDISQAIIFFRKSADQGFAPAQEHLGTAYLNGIGTDKNETDAVMWYRKAAEQEYKPAQANLEKLAIQQENDKLEKDREEQKKNEALKKKQKEENDIKKINKLKRLLNNQDEKFSKFPAWRKIYSVHIMEGRASIGFGSEVTTDDLLVISKFFDDENYGKVCIADSEQLYIISQGSDVKISVDNNTYKCKIDSGQWADQYTGNSITDINEVTIDHIVSFDDAWESGANQWNNNQLINFTNNERNLYANLYADTDGMHYNNFIIASKKNVDARNGETIENWSPDNKHKACNFINSYAAVKIKYNLTFLDNEVDVIKEWKDCGLHSAYDKGLVFDSIKKGIKIRD